MKCTFCGKNINVGYGNPSMCKECYDKKYEEKIDKNSETLTHPSDLKSWDTGDMSELFWLNLSRYMKEPTAKSYDMINLAFKWACHSSHGLSNSFDHALQWAKIDLYEEGKRWRETKK